MVSAHGQLETLKEATDERKSIRLALTSDKLKAFLTVTPVAGAGGFTVDELCAALGNSFPEERLDRIVLADIVRLLNKGEACSERRIGKGLAAEPGRDGRLVWLVKRLDGKREAAAEPTAFADFVALKLFDNVRAKQSIARVYPPTLGDMGVDVLGRQVVPTPGKALQLEVDGTVERQTGSSFDLLISKVDGYATQDGNCIVMKSELVISGDLNYRFGNVDFIGDVRVQGNVHQGFSVRSGGSVVIQGGTEGENLIDAQKNVTIQGTCVKTRVKCREVGTFKALREAVIECGGIIVLQKESFDSKLITAQSLDAGSAKVVGGELRMVLGAKVSHLGNSVEQSTRVYCCLPAEADLKFVDLIQAISKHEEALKHLDVHVAPYLQMKHRLKLLNVEARTRIEQLLAKRSEVQRSLQKLQDERQKLQGEERKDVQVEFAQFLHRGVIVTAGEHEWMCTETVKGPKQIAFQADKKEFAVTDVPKGEKK